MGPKYALGDVAYLREIRLLRETLEWIIECLEDELADGGKVPVHPDEIRERMA